MYLLHIATPLNSYSCILSSLFGYLWGIFHHHLHFGKSYQITDNVDCNSRNVVYLITCQFCHAQYVGSTRNKFRHRNSNHRSDIKSDKVIGGYASHFQNPDCKYSVQIIKKCHESNLLNTEASMYDLLKPSMNKVRPKAK